MSAETGLCKGLKRKAVRHGGFSAEHESRILRVSRLTGGKDRHSKVWTYKGARDRRVRLSVPTAIKFYDLQDRLRFEQPSMVIDWLINEAKAAIDELPALPPELPSVSQITSSNGSPIKAEGSSVTAVATAGTGPGPGPAPGPPVRSAAAVQDEQSKTQSPRKPQDGHLSCSPAQELDLGRSTSSTSDGSIKGEYRFPSKSAAIIRAKKREHARERTKNKPKASRKSPQKQHHHKLLNENMSKPLSVTEQWRGTSSSPLAILRTATAHNFYGNGGVPSNNMLQQLSDDTVTLASYSDMFCTQDSTTNPMHHMDSTSNTGITRSQPPTDNICVIGGTTTSTAALQCYELELAVSCLDQKQHRIAEANNSTMSQIQTSIPIFDLMRTMENPSPQLPISHLEMHFSSGIMPNNELNNLWSLSSRGPLQSNIVAAHMTAGLPHKNTYQDYSSGFSQVFRLQ